MFRPLRRILGGPVAAPPLALLARVFLKLDGLCRSPGLPRVSPRRIKAIARIIENIDPAPRRRSPFTIGAATRRIANVAANLDAAPATWSPVHTPDYRHSTVSYPHDAVARRRVGGAGGAAWRH
ncbi:hypothetical protein [Roseivivax sp. CAU 1753]